MSRHSCCGGGVSVPTKVTDPVCGRLVPSNSAHQVDHEGRSYRFCGEACAERFRLGLDPATAATLPYTCPEHAGIGQEGPGHCPLCGLGLVPAAPEPAVGHTLHRSPAGRALRRGLTVAAALALLPAAVLAVQHAPGQPLDGFASDNALHLVAAALALPALAMLVRSLRKVRGV